MRRYIYIILFILLYCSDIQSQLLYEISGNNSKSKSYLLATNKLVSKQFLDSIPNLFFCFNQCNSVITEFVMQDYEAISALRKAALLPDSVVLRNFYSMDEYTSIDEAFLLTMNLELSQLCRMKPSYLTEMYRTELLKKWLQYDEEDSMECFFEVIAQQKDIPIYGLDNIGETMYILFDREPFHWQCTELKKVIDYPENELKQEQKIKEMYLWGRLNDISYQVSSPDNTTSISFSDYQVYGKRNIQWVKRLKPLLAQGNCFITLNCIYLGGDKGLIQALRSAGYKVKAVNKRI